MHPNIIPPSVWVDLDEENTGLDVPANRLREHLEIPNITTSSGLREIRDNFDEINQRLSQCYATELGQGRTANATLVCVIWTKMAADTVIRERLTRAGVVRKVIPLLGTPLGVGLVEDLMRTFIDADEELALELFQHNLDIVRVLQDHPDDAQVVGHTIMALSRSFLWTILRHGPSHPSVFDDPCLVPVLSALLDTLRNPPQLLPQAAINVAMSILARVPPVCPQRCQLKDVPSLRAYYAAVSRSHCLRARCNAVATVLHLARAELQAEPRRDWSENVYPIVAHMSYMSGRENPRLDEFLSVLPDDLLFDIIRHGISRTECGVECNANLDAAAAISQYHPGDDLCELGLRLAELLPLAEFVVEPDTDLSHWHASDGSSLKQLDILPLCATSLTEKQGMTEQNAVDVLELHYLLATHADPQDIVQRAQRAIARNPRLAYARYAYAASLSLSSTDVALKLLAIEDATGLEGQTPFLQRQLLACTVHVAGQHAFDVLSGVADLDINVNTSRESELAAMASFRVALNAGGVYLHSAPPDARQLPAIFSWYIILRLVFEEQRPLSRCEPLLELICTTEQLTKRRRHPPAKTDIQLTREWLFEQYRGGSIRQWTHLTERLGNIEL